jgi:tetratricopeptide (TPR) repeat protein
MRAEFLDPMLSKLHIYCEGIMEAAWLAAAATIPLFFNVSSAQTFEPDKVFLLRFLAIISGAAFLLKRLTAQRSSKEDLAGEVSFRPLLRHPLVFLILSIAVLYTLSSIFSIMPAISWFGLYTRAQGTITFYSYAILFLVVLSELRNSAQLRRLQYVFIVTSLPVAGYGFLQHFRADSLPWGNAMPGRSSGSMGNPIFLGAYLAMVIPLTIGRLVQAVKMLRVGTNRKPGFVLACICGLALALQGLALLYTQSRGPVIGLVASGYICMFLFLVLHRAPVKNRLIFPAIAAGLGILAPVFVIVMIRFASGYGMKIAALCLGVASVGVGFAYWKIWRTSWGRNWLWLTWLAQTAALISIFSVVPLHTISESMGATPLGRLMNLSGNSVDVRRFLWQTGLNAVKSGSPAIMPDNTREFFHYLRPIIGYGPENVWFAANSYASPDLVRLHTAEAVDRMHSETFDALITTGFVGSALWLIIIAAAFYYALKLIGFCGGGGLKRSFICFSASGGLAGILLPWAAGSPDLMGVGVIAGLLAGVVAFAAWSGYRNRQTGFIGDDQRVFIFCILGALIAHSVETGVGIAVTSTRVYFFLLLALISVFSVKDLSRVEEPKKQRASKQGKRLKDPQSFFAVLSSFVLLVLCWCFIINRSNESSTLALFLQTWFVGYPGLQLKLLVPESLILLLLIVGGSIGLIYGEISDQQAPKTSFRKTAILSLGIMLSVWFVMAVFSAAFWTASDASSPLKASIGAESRVALFMIALCTLIIAAARRLITSGAARSAAQVPIRPRSAWIGVLVVLGALLAVQQLVLRPARADVVFRTAHTYERKADLWAAIPLYERALNLAPRVVRYWISLGLAQASAGAADAGLLQESFRSLRHAVDLNPFDPISNRTLAAIYMQDAERSAEPAARNERLNKAIAVYQRAARLAPNYPDAYCDLGRCYFLLGDHQKAASLYEKSLQMNPYYARTHMFMGEMHYRLNDLERAYQDFKTAYRLDKGNVETMRNLGFLLARMGRKKEAIRIYSHALEHAPGDLVSLRRLSALYFSLGDSVTGHTYARRAYDGTPAAEKGIYEKFAADLQNQ